MLLTLLLITLATYRLATDFTQEHGPFGLYRRTRGGLRAFAEARINNSAVNDPADHWLYWLYDGAECFHCVSFWCSLALTGLAVPWQPIASWPEILLTWLASTGLASALQRWLDSTNRQPATTLGLEGTKQEFHSWLNEYLSAAPSAHVADLEEQQAALQALLSSTSAAPAPPSGYADS